MKRMTLAVVGLLLLAPLAGCGSGSTSSSSSPSAAGSTGTAGASKASGSGGSSSGGCGGYSDGKGGVLHSFCDGHAKAHVTVDGAAFDLSGGECVQAGSTFAINIGVAVGPGFPSGKTKPNYLGILASSSTSSIALVDKGTAIAGSAKLTVSPDKKTVTGTATSFDGKKITVDVTC